MLNTLLCHFLYLPRVRPYLFNTIIDHQSGCRVQTRALHRLAYLNKDVVAWVKCPEWYPHSQRHGDGGEGVGGGGGEGGGGDGVRSVAK